MSVAGPQLQATIFEKSRPGRGGGKVPHAPHDALERIPAGARRATPPALPEMNEPEVVRHYVNLSQLNYSIDTGFYPLGSCTMKWNPKLNEWAARLPGFSGLHPLAPDSTAQGTLQLLWELEAQLAEISGMRAVTLQPAAGAQGELTGILMVRAYHRSRGEPDRTEVLVPDSSHGTNPATATMAGCTTITIPSAPDGGVDLDAFRAALGPRTAAVMITNPSTLGLFEARIGELLEAVHAAGALAYMDGANLNAILGRFKPGEAGFDVMHFNVHKTFSTPHGGGGPGAGPVGVGEKLVPFLPTPRVLRAADGTYRLERAGERPGSIGRMRSFVGNTGVLVRAYAYIRAHGSVGAARGERRRGPRGELPEDAPGWHLRTPLRSPVQARVRRLGGGDQAGDRDPDPRHGEAADRLRLPPADDLLPAHRRGGDAHRADRDRVARDARRVRRRAHRDRRRGVRDARSSSARRPHGTPVRRLDEATAARQPNLRWRPMAGAETPCPD